MARLRQLIAAVHERHPDDRFFQDFDESCRIEDGKRRAYRTYEDALRVLDERSWQVLKDKSVRHYRDHRRGQLKQGFFNQLNEAFAYRWLVRRGCTGVRMVPEGRSKTADIRYFEGGQRRHCEVKTIGLSDDEIERRRTRNYANARYEQLGQGLLNQLSDAVHRARTQIEAHGTHGWVYVILLWNDMALDYYQEHRRQIIAYCRAHSLDDVYIKVGSRWFRRIRITRRCT